MNTPHPTFAGYGWLQRAADDPDADIPEAPRYRPPVYDEKARAAHERHHTLGGFAARVPNRRVHRKGAAETG